MTHRQIEVLSFKKPWLRPELIIPLPEWVITVKVLEVLQDDEEIVLIFEYLGIEPMRISEDPPSTCQPCKQLRFSRSAHKVLYDNEYYVTHERDDKKIYTIMMRIEG